MSSLWTPYGEHQHRLPAPDQPPSPGGSVADPAARGGSGDGPVTTGGQELDPEQIREMLARLAATPVDSDRQPVAIGLQRAGGPPLSASASTERPESTGRGRDWPSTRWARSSTRSVTASAPTPSRSAEAVAQLRLAFVEVASELGRAQRHRRVSADVPWRQRDRGLRPHRRHPDRGARRQRRLDRLAVRAPVRLRRVLRRAARRPRRTAAGSIGPASGGSRRTERRYRDGTLVLETTFDTPTTAPSASSTACRSATSTSTSSASSRASAGRVPMRMDLTVRFDYGSRSCRGCGAIDGDVTVRRRPGRGLRLATPVPTQGQDFRDTAEFMVERGRPGAVRADRLAVAPAPWPEVARRRAPRSRRTTSVVARLVGRAAPTTASGTTRCCARSSP